MRSLVTLILLIALAIPAVAAETAATQQLSSISGFGPYLFGQPFSDFDADSLEWY